MSNKSRVHRHHPKPRRIAHYKRKINGRNLDQESELDCVFKTYDLLIQKYEKDPDMRERIFNALYLLRRIWTYEFREWDMMHGKK